MTRFSKYVTLIVVFHFIVVVLHGSAHHMIPIPTSLLQSLFIISIITLAPLVATIMLWRKSFNTGTALLFSSMLGALVFGVYNHFILISLDHVSQITPTLWGQVFQITAVLLMISEILAVGVAFWGLMVTSKREKSQ